MAGTLSKNGKRLGRPRKNPLSPHAELVKIIKLACRLGGTEPEVAVMSGLTEPALRKLAMLHEEIAEALKVGDTVSDDRVEASLYKRAIGYTKIVRKVVAYEGEYQIAELEEEVDPDPKACMWWLSLRRKDKWGSPAQNGEVTINMPGQEGGNLRISYHIKGANGDTAVLPKDWARGQELLGSIEEAEVVK